MAYIIPQLILNSLITGCLYSLAAVGLSITFSAYRFLNFSHGHTIMFGAYLFYTAKILFGFDFFPSVLLCLLCCVPISIIFQRLFIQPFFKINPLLGFISTLGLSVILESLVSIFYGVNVHSVDQGSLSNSIQFFVFSCPVSITYPQLYLLTTCLTIGLFTGWLVFFSGIGIRVRALQESSIYYDAFGMNADFMGLLSFCFSTAIAFICGIALSYETNIQPTMGSYVMLKAFAAIVVAGLGNIPESIIGAFILAFLENIISGVEIGGYSIPVSFKDSVAFMIILLILLVKSQGLFSSKSRAA